MSRSHRMLTLTALGLVVASGLGACKSHRTGATGPARHGRSTGTRSASPRVTGMIRWHDAPAAGATVVAVDHPGESVTTGADGRYSLSLPVGSMQLIRVSRRTERTVHTMAGQTAVKSPKKKIVIIKPFSA